MVEQFGRYEVRGELGRGGMATVYRAWDPRFDRDVAVKVLSHRLTDDPSFRTRFEREARAIAALEHHAIVPVYDYGEEGENLYLVMRLLSGGSLADRVERGPMWLDAIAPVVERVADALDYAHGRGVIHRDVKPANIMFDVGGNAFLADFGIARLAEQTSTLTGLGVVGSPTYMSPEQAEGKPITGASDIYSLGATTYEALAGRPPFSAENPLAVLIQHIRDEPPSLTTLRPDLPESADEAVRQAMAKEPGARPETARAFAVALRETTVRRQPSGGATVVEAGRVASPPRPGPSTAPMPPPPVAERIPPAPVAERMPPPPVASQAPVERVPDMMATRVAGGRLSAAAGGAIGEQRAIDWWFVGAVAAGGLLVFVGYLLVDIWYDLSSQPHWSKVRLFWPHDLYQSSKEFAPRVGFVTLLYLLVLLPVLGIGASAIAFVAERNVGGPRRRLANPSLRAIAIAVIGVTFLYPVSSMLAFKYWDTQFFFSPVGSMVSDLPSLPLITIGAAVILGASFFPERRRST